MRDTTETAARAPHHAKAFSVKAEDVRDDGTFAGYGSVFNVQDGGYDIVMPGAFAESLAEHKANGTMPKLLWQHDPWEPIGLWTTMREDGHGLYCEGKLLLDIELGRKAHVLLKNRAIDGLSIGFDCQEWEIENADGEAMPPPGPYGPFICGPQTRRLKKISLWEVSVVTFPMNQDARIETVKRRDPVLRDPGLYRAAADVARIAKQVRLSMRTDGRKDDVFRLQQIESEIRAALDAEDRHWLKLLLEELLGMPDSDEVERLRNLAFDTLRELGIVWMPD